MILSNVNIGTGPSAGDGDPLRTAFTTINNNFAKIQSNVNSLSNSVTSVAGRTGNVTLTVGDIVGINQYANTSYTTTLITNQVNALQFASNASVDAKISANISALINGAPGALDTLNELAAALGDDSSYATTITNLITSLEANIATYDGNIATLFANAGAQSGTLASLTTGFNNLAANTAVLSGRIGTLESNAAVQAGAIATLTANAGAQAGSLATLTSNAGVQAGILATIQSDITTLTSNAAVQAGDIASLQSGFDSLAANAASQAGAIATLTANAASQASLVTDIATLTANAAVQAGAIATLTSNAAVQADAIATLTANAGAQAGSLVSLQSGFDSLAANAAVQAGSIATLTANAAVQAGILASLGAVNLSVLQSNISSLESSITTLTSNAAVQAGSIATLTANAAVQAGAITTLTSNAAVQAGDIATIYANLGSVSGSLASIAANVYATGYSNSNVASYLTTYSGNILVGNLVFDDLSVQTTAYTGTQWRSNLTSSLTSKPSWLSYYPGLKNQLGTQYGFDASGMFFTSNSDNDFAYPIQTNLHFHETDVLEVVATIFFSATNNDQGLCIFPADTRPIWKGGVDTSRIAFQYTSGIPVLYGQTTANTAPGSPVLTAGNYYTIKFTYDPTNTITVETFSGNTATGSAVDSRTLNEVLPAGDYRIGFDADNDAAGIKSYFKNLTVRTLTNTVVTDLEVQGEVTGNLIPSANVTYNLGSPTNWWKDLFLSGNTIHLGGTTISTSGGAVLTPVTRQLFSQSFLPGGTNSAATFTLDRLPTAGSTRTVVVIGEQGIDPPGPAPSYTLTEGVNFTISGLSLIITASYTATNISCTESYSDTGDLITATEVATDTITPGSGDLTVSGNVTVDGDLYVSPTSIYMGNLRISAADGNLKVNTGIKFSDDSVQSTAWTGSAPEIDITDTNGLTTIYYPTFVENRTTGQIARADVNLTYRTDDNILGVGNIAIGAAGNITFSDSTVQTTAWTGFTANTANWSNPAPSTLNDAIDRLAILVKTLNSGTGA